MNSFVIQMWIPGRTSKELTLSFTRLHFVCVMIRYDRHKDLGDDLSVALILQVPNYEVTHLIVSLLP